MFDLILLDVTQIINMIIGPGHIPYRIEIRYGQYRTVYVKVWCYYHNHGLDGSLMFETYRDLVNSTILWNSLKEQSNQIGLSRQCDLEKLLQWSPESGWSARLFVRWDRNEELEFDGQVDPAEVRQQVQDQWGIEYLNGLQSQ